MSDGPPAWLLGVLKAEKRVAPQLKTALESTHFFNAVGVVTEVRRQVNSRGERLTRGLLHRVNLPAGSDITRLLTEIGRLQNQVRELSVQVERQRGATPAVTRTGRARPS